MFFTTVYSVSLSISYSCEYSLLSKLVTFFMYLVQLQCYIVGTIVSFIKKYYVICSYEISHLLCFQGYACPNEFYFWRNANFLVIASVQ